MAKTHRNRRVRKRDSRLADAYMVCERSLKRFLYQFSSRSEDIDEMAQEAFLRAFDAESRQEIQSPKAYLFRVARNIALRELNKKSRQLTDYLEESVGENVLSREASTEEDVIAQQKLQQYCNAIAELPEQCRRVFLLRKVQAYSHKEIAAQLNISVRTVEKHIAKRVDRFTDYMASQESPLEPGSDGSTPTKHRWS